MSAPHTNLEKQARHHRGPLIGFIVVLAVVAGLFVWWLGDVAQNGTGPQRQGPQMNDQTGKVEQSQPKPKITPQPALTNDNGTQPTGGAGTVTKGTGSGSSGN